jgi:2-polyprenyl-3-methyl-5-hydroxy-6-metoxy-1,4-benzoquinol methylase
MGFGTRIRHALGPLEAPISAAYRGFFFDVTAFADRFAQGLTPRSVLEIGCGEGAVLEQLAQRFPNARLRGIDPSPHSGRAVRGHDRIACTRQEARELVAEGTQYDVVLLCDVLHHVDVPARDALLRDAWALVAPAGALVVKEWVRRWSVRHVLSHVLENYLTGSPATYLDEAELRARLSRACGTDSLERWTHRPGRNNATFVVRRANA